MKLEIDFLKQPKKFYRKRIGPGPTDEIVSKSLAVKDINQLFELSEDPAQYEIAMSDEQIALALKQCFDLSKVYVTMHNVVYYPQPDPEVHKLRSPVAINIELAAPHLALNDFEMAVAWINNHSQRTPTELRSAEGRSIAIRRPGLERYLYSTFIDLAYEPEWMAYASGPLGSMLIPEPDEMPTLSASDPLSLAPTPPLPATALASAAGTAPKPPPDPNASATREDYEEAQAAKRAAEQAAAKATEPAKPKKKPTMARKSALLSTPEQVSAALAEQPDPSSGPIKLRIKPLERPTPSTAEQSPAHATRAQTAAATPTTPATPVETPKSPLPPAERTPRSSQTPPRLEIAEPGEAPASAPLRTSPRVTPRVTPQNK